MSASDTPNLQEALRRTLELELDVGGGLLASTLLARVEIRVGVALEEVPSRPLDEALVSAIARAIESFHPGFEQAEIRLAIQRVSQEEAA